MAKVSSATVAGSPVHLPEGKEGGALVRHYRFRRDSRQLGKVEGVCRFQAQRDSEDDSTRLLLGSSHVH